MPTMYKPDGTEFFASVLNEEKYLSMGYTKTHPSTFASGWSASAVAPAKAVPEYRTQKARGIKALNDSGYAVPHFDVHGIEEFITPIDNQGQMGLFPDEKTLSQLIDKFVRPCPMVPRHGFVDSRPIRTIEEAQKIVDETIAAEEKAELVCMPFINAEFSAIWTEGKMIIGPSNDGATGGHGSKVIPVLGIPSRSLTMWASACKLASVTDAPYLELLWTKKYPYDESYKNYYVQLRNGPKLPTTIDFIPEKLEVTNVVEASGDLLEWETKAKGFDRGTVVYHPGGSLASHYAVHAVLNKIPVLVSRQPKVGEILEPNTEVKAPDARQVKLGFLLGCQHNMNYHQAALVMLVGCHSTSLWAGNNDLMLGFSLGAMYRLIITAALGEARHKPKNKHKNKASRNAVYEGVWDKILNQSTRTRYMAALDSFENDNWNGSFGGQKWLDFSRYAGYIFNAVLKEDVTEALTAFNKAVNMAHNSGWAFDKFLNKETLDETAVNPAFTLVKCAPEFYQASVKADESPELADWFKWKKPFKVDSPKEEITKEGEARANKQVAKEIRQAVANGEEESNDCGDCGDCDCMSCNPDGDNCNNHICETCFPDGCPDAHRNVCCKTCHPWGCGNVKCTNCNAKKKITAMQGKFYDAGTLKIQIKIEGERKYKTKYLKVPEDKKQFVKELFSNPEMVKVLSFVEGSGMLYYPAEPNSSGYWFFGYTGKKDRKGFNIYNGKHYGISESDVFNGASN